jgi:hypothetical protein
MELNSIDFNTEGTGYLAANQGRMYKSTDNGLSWAEVESPGPNEYIYVSVFEEDIVYIVDANGHLYSNKDEDGIEEPGKDLIGIYPNPADAEIHIRIPKNHLLIECSIYDIRGRNLLNSREKKIQLNGISQGIYLLEVNTSNGVFRKKFLKR